jgi:hypothetical protein
MRDKMIRITFRHLGILRFFFLVFPLTSSAEEAFEIPQNLTIVNSGFSENAAHLTFDGLSLYIYRGAVSSGQIYVSTRTSLTDPFGPLTTATLNNLNLPKREFPGSLSSDGLTIYFHSDPLDGTATNSEIYYSKRTNVNDPFPSPQLLNSVTADIYSDSYPKISFDGKSLYFLSDRPGNGPFWIAKRDSPSGDFTRVSQDDFSLINTIFDAPKTFADGYSISKDELTLYFGLEKIINTVTYRYLRVSRRNSTIEPFPLPDPNDKVLANLNTEFASSPAISPFDNELFFTSGRTGGSGSDDIWIATLK